MDHEATLSLSAHVTVGSRGDGFMGKQTVLETVSFRLISFALCNRYDQASTKQRNENARGVERHSLVLTIACSGVENSHDDTGRDGSRRLRRRCSF